MAAKMEDLMAVIGLDASPISVLCSMRGPIVEARVGYPEVLHVTIRDSKGELWRLATQDADWSPADPDSLIGRSVEDAEIDSETCELRCRLSGGSSLVVRPTTGAERDDPPSWELIAPTGMALEFGPGLRWQIGGAD